MHRRARFALLALLCVGGPTLAQEAGEWLVRMEQALGGIDYQGDLVYAHGNQIEALRIFHANGPDGGRERLISLNGAAREVIRAGGQVTCIGTGQRPAVYGDAAMSASMLGTQPGFDAVALQRHYAIGLGSVERVADLEAQVLVLQPRDAYRYGYRLWLERQTGLPLKSVRFGADGRPVEQLMFTRIALHQRPSDIDLAGDAVSGASHNALSVPQPAGAQVATWRVIDPPPGFTLAAQQPAPTAQGEHLIYSDGIASVSVYVEPLQGGPVFSGAASRGAINLYGRITAGRQVTVLGDVPAATVERFAQGIAALGVGGG
jgi:sigma-E factor negative regulatory protein RseB